VVVAREEAVAVVEAELEAAAVELAPNRGDAAGGRRDGEGAGRDDEVGAVVAVVAELAAPEVVRLGDARGPAALDRGRDAVHEV
jgi:hypothetical protein